MDRQTSDYYSRNASDLVQQYDAARVDDLFIRLHRHLQDKTRVLEIGAGSGRDASFLLSLGLDVTGLEGNEAMRQAALALHPELNGRLHQESFPVQDDSPWLKQRFHAVVSIATFMHIPDQDLFTVASQIRDLLLDDGVLFLSSSTGRQGLLEGRDADGRLFLERPAEELQLLFERLGFRLVAKYENADAFQRSLSWVTLVLQRAENRAFRSLDAIETIITRDRKVATYKLALLRALCEIARTEHRLVRWSDDGFVRVPLGLVAEKWLLYYWPLVEADGPDGLEVRFPQQRGGEKKQQIAIRGPLRALINAYRPLGGLSALHHHYRTQTVPPKAISLLDASLNSIAQAIVDGPVTHAGGALEEPGSFFGFEGPKAARHRCTSPKSTCEHLGRIKVPVGAWRELCLIGHWVAESLLLRWAELTHQIAPEKVSIQKAVELLLISPSDERDVRKARLIYSGLEHLRCVWTDRALPHDFAVDHALPFSVWRSNDLWNLLPTSSRINSQKSDRLVTRGLLLRRRDAIIGYWSEVRKHAEERFRMEVSRSLIRGIPDPGNWQLPAFAGLLENVELMALQRGLPRWEP